MAFYCEEAFCTADEIFGVLICGVCVGLRGGGGNSMVVL